MLQPSCQHSSQQLQFFRGYYGGDTYLGRSSKKRRWDQNVYRGAPVIRQKLPEALGGTAPVVRCLCPGGHPPVAPLRDLTACGPSAGSPPHLLSGSWDSNHVDIALLTPSPATQAPWAGPGSVLQDPAYLTQAWLSEGEGCGGCCSQRGLVLLRGCRGLTCDPPEGGRD